MAFWDDIAANSRGVYATADFESAAYRLVAEQVLYHSDMRARSDYNLVERYERDFQRALDIVGVNVEVNRQLRYACAIPRNSRSTFATTNQTLLALVLRALYDDAARRGDLTDEGEVVCDIVELTQRYTLMTQRDLPAKGEFDAAVKMLQRWGIARYLVDPEFDGRTVVGNAGALAIRPAIVQLLGETALARLAAWSKPPGDTANSAEDSVADNEDDIGEEENEE
ncbi:DUF4194 domain-containing protein [Burkholderia cenocepacia]|uniref:DUF4194 domain-containing protein n=1 Tax=Burkholderia cenocepacia TaxID=95486 RepID=UPI00158BAE50|nr:DUF4194 domain-containing protein [Burkholderia cenocepacia]MBR8380492.1 DUF4194 domain-containing protein [Burkholderia cenocepacia]MBR8415060.1 DUF4194 domain-containing protein [Burkholderia cenocepacia]MCA8238981.1 DUF4194 domain-containing protein [Burkholderia cenocepacia]MDS0849638.1 DUF4194 domain-containing protein [Burkholderia cenocepacia]